MTQDRPVQKSDGSWTYFAPDIAYHYNKVQRGFDELIDIFGADHSRLCQAAEGRRQRAVGKPGHAGHQADPTGEAAEERRRPFKMSKRAGTFVTLRDVVDEVGADVTRFVMLTRKNDVALDFDFDKVTGAVEGQPGLLRAIRECPDQLDPAQGARGGAGGG